MERLVCRLGVAALLASTVDIGVAQVLLQIKFPAGARYRQVQAVVVDQTSTEGSSTRKTRSAQRFVVGVENGPRDAEGVSDVSITTLESQLEMEMPDGTTVAFDSTAPPQQSDHPVYQIVAQMAQAMNGAKLTYRVDADRRVVGVVGIEEIIARSPPEAGPTLQKRLDAARLAKRFSEEINRLPDRPVSPGQRWRQPYDFDLDAGQHLVFERHYQYVGPVADSGERLHEIRIADQSVRYLLDPDDNLPISLKQSALKVVRSSGRMIFNSDLGRVAEAHIATRVAGDLVLALGETEVPSKLDLTFSIDTTTEDELPESP